jgi:hypothetical protein
MGRLSGIQSLPFILLYSRHPDYPGFRQSTMQFLPQQIQTHDITAYIPLLTPRYSPQKKQALKACRITLFWWRRRESNPRPKTVSHGYLHVYPAILSRAAASPPAGRFSASLLEFRSSGGDPPFRYPVCATFLRVRAGIGAGNVVALRRLVRKYWCLLLFSDRD